MDTKDILIQVRELIADPEYWTQGSWARRQDGSGCLPEFTGAVQWCLGGAVSKMVDDKLANPVSTFLNKCAYELFDTGVPSVNDRFGHSAVIELLDYAIERCERGE